MLKGIIRYRVDPDSIVHSDGWRGNNGRVDLGYKSIIELILDPISLFDRKSYITV